MRRENWIKWDLSSREDLRLKWFLNQYKDKARAYGFFLWIVELLYNTNDGWIPLDDVFSEGFGIEIGWSKEDVSQAIAKLIQAKLFLLEANRFASKRVLREILETQNLSKIRAEAGRKGGINSSTSKANSSKPKQNQAKPIDKIRVDKIRIDNINTPPKPKVDGKTKFGEYVYLSLHEQVHFEGLLGKEVFNRCVEKLDAWIASDPSIKRKRNGKNAGACFRSWVINSIAEEQQRASRSNNIKKITQSSSALETLGGFLDDKS